MWRQPDLTPNAQAFFSINMALAVKRLSILRQYVEAFRNLKSNNGSEKWHQSSVSSLAKAIILHSRYNIEKRMISLQIIHHPTRNPGIWIIMLIEISYRAPTQARYRSVRRPKLRKRNQFSDACANEGSVPQLDVSCQRSP